MVIYTNNIVYGLKVCTKGLGATNAVTNYFMQYKSLVSSSQYNNIPGKITLSVLLVLI